VLVTPVALAPEFEPEPEAAAEVVEPFAALVDDALLELLLDEHADTPRTPASTTTPALPTHNVRRTFNSFRGMPRVRLH
jgi:hypothetical protein